MLSCCNTSSMPAYAHPGNKRNPYDMPLLAEYDPALTHTGLPDPQSSFTNSTLNVAETYRLGKPEAMYSSSKNEAMKRLADRGMPAYFIKHLNPGVYINVSGI